MDCLCHVEVTTKPVYVDAEVVKQFFLDLEFLHDICHSWLYHLGRTKDTRCEAS